MSFSLSGDFLRNGFTSASSAVALGSSLRVGVPELPSLRDVVDLSYEGVGRATESGWLAGTYGIDAPSRRRWSGWNDEEPPGTMAHISAMIENYNLQNMPDWMKVEQFGQAPIAGSGPGQGMFGGLAVAGGRFAPLDQVNNLIASAGAQTGVPPNLIKAMLLRESSGIWGAPVNYTIRPQMGGVLPYNGIFEVTARSRGIDFNRMVTDQGYAIWAMGKVLADIGNEDASQWGGAGTIFQQWGWEGVAARYFSGNPNPTNTWGDELDSNTQNYLYGPNGVMTHVKFLESLNPVPAGGAGSGAMSSPNSPAWQGVNQWDTLIMRASAQTGVPPNVIKAIMRLESGGVPTAVSVSGAQGLMQVMPFHFSAGVNMQDPWTNILKGAQILADNRARWESWAQQNNLDPWIAASRAYLAGTPYSGQYDANNTSTDVYGDRITQYLAELGGAGTPGTGTSTSPMTMSMIWGNIPNTTMISGFREPSGNGLYGYGVGHGTNGVEHTGIDIGMPVGTPLFSPGSGVVTCAGTNNGPGSWNTGCSAFNDTFGQGAGRIEILLDTGVSLILGHSSTTPLVPGQRVTAGQLVGTSGGMVSPHPHIETRIWDGTTWQIVDPMQALGGMIYTGPGGAVIPGANATPQPYNYYTWLRLAMQGAMPGGGMYPTGYGPSNTSWVHNTLRNALAGVFIPRPLPGV